MIKKITSLWEWHHQRNLVVQELYRWLLSRTFRSVNFLPSAPRRRRVAVRCDSFSIDCQINRIKATYWTDIFHGIDYVFFFSRWHQKDFYLPRAFHLKSIAYVTLSANKYAIYLYSARFHNLQGEDGTFLWTMYPITLKGKTTVGFQQDNCAAGLS